MLVPTPLRRRPSALRALLPLLLTLGACSFYRGSCEVPGGSQRLLAGNRGSDAAVWVMDDKGCRPVRIEHVK